MHAVLITAHKDYRTLDRLVRRLDRNFFKIYVHIDKRSAIGRDEIDALSSLGAKVVKRYRIRWGAIAHLYAILDLLRDALNDGEVDYIHLISGQDYPLAGPAKFKQRCDGRIFMNFGPLVDESDYIKDRYRLRNFFYFLRRGPRMASGIYRRIDPVSRWIQRHFGITRTHFGPFDRIYKGIVWMSFPTAAAADLLEDEAAAEFLKAIRTAYLPEEVFFQTYFLNSRLSGSIVNDDLRYADWHFRNGSVPAFLDESDLQPIMHSNALFARKMSSEISARLMDRIDEACFSAEQILIAVE